MGLEHDFPACAYGVHPYKKMADPTGPGDILMCPRCGQVRPVPAGWDDDWDKDKAAVGDDRRARQSAS